MEVSDEMEEFQFQGIQIAEFIAFKDKLDRIEARSFEPSYLGCDSDEDSDGDSDDGNDVGAPSDTSADSGTFLMITGEHGTGISITFVFVFSR